jgi:phage shock protein A
MDERQDVEVKEAVPETGAAERTEERQVNEVSARVEKMREELRKTIESIRTDVERLELRETRDRARAWMKEHPGLVALFATGAGMMIGGVLTRALTPKPAPLSTRARRRAKRLAGRVGRVARETGAHLVHDAVDVGQKLMDQVSRESEKLPRRARKLGEEVAHRTEALAETIVHQAEAAAKEGMEEIMESLQTHKKMHGALDSLFRALRAALAVAFFKKMSDRVRRQA